MKYVKLLVFVTILVSLIGAIVFATDPESDNDVCKTSSKQLFNGSQNKNGECVTTVMGEVPDTEHMVSTVIRFPKNGDKIKANTNFTIRTKSINLSTGFFSDPATTYYKFPQTLDDEGFIQGHSHVSVQKIEDENEPPNPKAFAFFKGLNLKADENGELTILVENGLDVGNYRVCTMTSSFSHQPLLMPVAQRGKLLNLKILIQS